MEKIKKALSILLRIGISIILLILLFKFSKIDTRELISDIKSANGILLAVAFIIFFIVYALGFLRWQMLLKAVGINIPLTRLVISFSGGLFFSILLPSTIGGDVVRTADLAQHSKKTKEVIATVFLDRLSGYIGLVLLVLPVLLLGSGLVRDKVVFLSVAVIILLLVFILLVLFNKSIYSGITGFLSSPGAGKIKEWIKNLHREIHIFRHQRKIIIYNLTLSFIIQAISPVSIYFIALSLGIKTSLVYFFIFIPIIGAITLLPISMGGLGVRENFFAVYFAKVGISKQLAVAMSLLSFFFIIIYGVIGGLIYVLTVRHRRMQYNPSP